ncbi:MAG: DUF2332 domain-containing protein [Actinomycetota bacterium]|nr:DUF2332 domain-containing protein [Actinomycetota bacterium]MDQ2956776.1 DUF2332 domain-containing protein [Actinomycetota bacterium]
METSAWYRRFASAEARGQSACYQAWADGVANDQQLIELVDELPEVKRQPNLVFGAARFVGIAAGPFERFREELISGWAQVRAVVLSKRTQTNEPGRCAVLLPVLAALPQPLALLEVGASAGLCLYPDRFSYQFGDRPRLDPADGPGPLLRCAIDGPVPVPTALPEVVWRAGIDLNPLDVTDPDDVRWLETLIWPEQSRRREQLAAAIAIARTDPPLLVSGDLTEMVDQLIGRAPADATLVVFHSAVLTYLDRQARDCFAARMRDAAAHWISNEGPGVITVAAGSLPDSPDPLKALFVIAHDGEPVAYADGHGQALYWFG